MQEEKLIDPFILYGKVYKDVRSAVNTVIFTKKTDELAACIQVWFFLTHHTVVYLPLCVGWVRVKSPSLIILPESHSLTSQ